MPQLVPFYFLNQVFYGFSALLILIYIMSQFILPRILYIFLSRIFISKL